MSYNGSGAFSINTAGQPVAADTSISSTVFNALTADLATGLSTAICKDGQTTITANIPLSTFKLTGVGNGTDKQDAATIANIVAGTGIYVGTVGGTADVITLTASPAVTAYAAGQRFFFVAGGTNTTNVTVNVSSLGAKALTKTGTNALTAGDIVSGMIVSMVYDGTRFILDSYRPFSGTWTPVLTCATPGNLAVTYATQSGRYVRNGRLVTVSFDILTSAFTHTTASGDVSITGLPFTSNASLTYQGSLFFGGITKANYTQFTPTPDTGATTMTIYCSGSAQAFDALEITNMPSGGTVKLVGTVTYETN
jgi:hypothetical protein